MSELERILDSIKPEKLAFYALYGTKLSEERTYDYDSVLENSCNDFLKFIKEQCPDVNITALDDKIIHFISAYSEIYLEIGMIAGYVLSKEMGARFHSLGLDDVIEQIADLDK
ncbi:MAG: hypothetical protein HDQ96_09960 [Lachnospiraceae bacterium]|nr:hypothetical protein [Lachnospiraceae bacterium]